MDVIEHITVEDRVKFRRAWWQLTGWHTSFQESIVSYWLRRGFTRQAG